MNHVDEDDRDFLPKIYTHRKCIPPCSKARQSERARERERERERGGGKLVHSFKSYPHFFLLPFSFHFDVRMRLLNITRNSKNVTYSIVAWKVQTREKREEEKGCVCSAQKCVTGRVTGSTQGRYAARERETGGTPK